MESKQGLKSESFPSNLGGMSKGSRRDALPSFITERPSVQYPSKEDIDHLTYLEKRPSLFEHEEDENFREWRLVCASCGHLVTTVSEKMEVRGAATIMISPIMVTSSGWAVIAMLRDALALRGSQTGIPGSGGMLGKFSCAGTVTLNWVGSICLRTPVFTALCSNCCAKKSQRSTTEPHPERQGSRVFAACRTKRNLGRPHVSCFPPSHHPRRAVSNCYTLLHPCRAESKTD